MLSLLRHLPPVVNVYIGALLGLAIIFGVFFIYWVKAKLITAVSRRKERLMRRRIQEEIKRFKDSIKELTIRLDRLEERYGVKSKE